MARNATPRGRGMGLLAWLVVLAVILMVFLPGLVAEGAGRILAEALVQALSLIGAIFGSVAGS